MPAYVIARSSSTVLLSAPASKFHGSFKVSSVHQFYVFADVITHNIITNMH